MGFQLPDGRRCGDDGPPLSQASILAKSAFMSHSSWERFFNWYEGDRMNTQISIGLALVIVSLLCLEMFFFNWDGTIFLMRKMADLIEWMAFWR
jgi:hypothetical protein